MNEEILKLAKECGGFNSGEGFVLAVYRAAYNKAIEDAAKKCDTRAEIMAMMGGNCDPDVLAEQIRELEMR